MVMFFKKNLKYKPQNQFHAHSHNLKEIEQTLRTSYNTGLTSDEASRRLKIYGPNIIPPVKGSIWAVYFSPLFNWLINIYLIVSAILLLLSIWVPETRSQVSFWMVYIVFNIFFVVFQQIRAQKKLDTLHKLAPPMATVLRENRINKIPASELTVGDIITLEQGDRVPADARLIAVSNLVVNESTLTGESVPVEKTHSPFSSLPLDIPLSQQLNMVYKGTFIEYGRSSAVVVSTGVYTELGNLAREISAMSTNEIPIRAKVNVLAKWLGVAVLLFISSSVTYKLIAHIQRGTISDISLVMNDLVISFTTAMAIMPIAIPLWTTLILLTGILSMAKNKVIIRNISAIETLGRCSVLATDKTGTITENKMVIEYIWDTKRYYTVSGVSYTDNGSIKPLRDNESKKELPSTHLRSNSDPYSENGIRDILIGGLLNNNAHLIADHEPVLEDNSTWTVSGNSTDAAFLVLFNKSDLNESRIRENYTFIKEYNFDSKFKRMTKIFQNGAGEGYILFCKGATEKILPRCDYIGSANGTSKVLNQELRTQILAEVENFAGEGYRILSLASRVLSNDLAISRGDQRDDFETQMIYNGFVCIQDPPRKGVKRAVKECDKAGITSIMITGDSSQTAKSIAQKVGIIDKNESVVEGNKIMTLTDDSFFSTKVFARVTPKHKQQIVKRYKSVNRVVAMTGDGINDSLALTQADCGICMGMRGTEVAKQSSDIIIADDSFVSTVLGIKEGRGLFDKIRYMIFFYITVNIAEAIIYFASSYIPEFVLVNNVQRVFLFTTAHFIPVLVFIIDDITTDVMNYPPRNEENIFNKSYWGALVVLALSLAISAGTMYLLCYYGIIPVYPSNQSIIEPTFDTSINIVNPVSWQHAKARTMFLMVLLIAESLVILSIRHFNKPVWKSLKENFSLLVLFLVLFIPIGLLFILYISSIQNFMINTLNMGLEFLPLSLLDWIFVFIAVSVALVPLELYKYFVRKKGNFF